VEGSLLADIEREICASSHAALRAYLHGASRDGTFNRLHGTWRISQSDERWLQVLRAQVVRLGRKAWIYRESTRRVWTVETKLDLSQPAAYGSRAERIAFARGYFDADGGVPREPSARFYVQFVQKDWADLSRLREVLVGEGLVCGGLHNPSRRVDPDFWRFYVGAASQRSFASVVGSWHPRKRAILDARYPRAGLTPEVGGPARLLREEPDLVLYG
jgi:hypothetical protein